MATFQVQAVKGNKHVTGRCTDLRMEITPRVKAHTVTGNIP
jgi:hypothetical protein